MALRQHGYGQEEGENQSEEEEAVVVGEEEDMCLNAKIRARPRAIERQHASAFVMLRAVVGVSASPYGHPRGKGAA